jgi:tetratricopeptide (TPR) repeat protein
MTCPVCGAPLSPAAERCDYCHSWLVLEVDHSVIDPSAIDRSRIHEHIAAFRKRLKVDPDDAQAQYGLGIAYINLGLYHEAADALVEATRLTPENGAMQVLLGIVYAELVELGETQHIASARERARRALILDSHLVDAYLLQARIAARSSEHRVMLDRLQVAIDLEPDSIRPLSAAWLTVNRALVEKAPQFAALHRRPPQKYSLSFLGVLLGVLSVCFVAQLVNQSRVIDTQIGLGEILVLGILAAVAAVGIRTAYSRRPDSAKALAAREQAASELREFLAGKVPLHRGSWLPSTG